MAGLENQKLVDGMINGLRESMTEAEFIAMMADAEKKTSDLNEAEGGKRHPRKWQVTEVALGQLSQKEQWELLGQAGGGLAQTNWENWKTAPGAETIIPIATTPLSGHTYES